MPWVELGNAMDMQCYGYGYEYGYAILCYELHRNNPRLVLLEWLYIYRRQALRPAEAEGRETHRERQRETGAGDC